MLRCPPKLLVCLLVAFAWPLVAARPRPNLCTETAEWQTVRDSVKAAVHCRNQALRLGPAGACTRVEAPGCALNLVEDALLLGYGAEPASPVAFDSAVLESQWNCQSQIGSGLRDYVWMRLKHRIAGFSEAEADALARPQLDAIPAACNVDVAQDAGGVVLPAVGPQCDAAVGAVGATVDGGALRDCLSTLLTFWVERVGPEPAPLRPNVVLVLTDDQRWDGVGPEHAPPGSVVMPTVVSELIGKGLAFDESFVTTPHCCPSRASIQTGQYASTHGVLVNIEDHPYDESATLATWLDGAGYRNGLFGKYKNGYPVGPVYVPEGWHEWQAFKAARYYNYILIENGQAQVYGSNVDDYSTDLLRDRALAFIDDSVAAGKPFYLHYSPLAPHNPPIAAPRHQGLFAGIAPFRPPSFMEPDVSDKPAYVRNRSVFTPNRTAQLDQNRILMLETLRSVDEAIAAILQKLVDHGIEDDTIVIFLSDNGHLWGEHRYESKKWPYEENIRTPLVIRYPRLIPLPRRESRFSLNIDLAQTIVELSGGFSTLLHDGRSLVPILDGTVREWRQDFLLENWRDISWAGVREVGWKYIEYETGESELYDLTNDPYELDNLAADPAQAARVATMAARLRELRPGWPDDLE